MSRLWIVLVSVAWGCTVVVEDGSDPTGDDPVEQTGDDDDAPPPGDDDDDDDDTPVGAVPDCAGFHAGTYEGDDFGIAEGVLEADGTLTMTFINFVDIELVGRVHPDGEVEGTHWGYAVSGTYDFSDCTMSGDWWELLGNDEGTWQGALQ